MVEIKVTNSPGPSRTVTFQPDAARLKLEDDIYKSIREVFSGKPEEVIREAIRKRPEIELNDRFISSVIDELLQKENSDKNCPVYGPEKQSTASDAMDCMDIVPFNPSPVDKKDVDLEQMIRNPNISTGLCNSGNTCWFNCLVQMLYSLPKFRSVLYHCVPLSWLATPIVNINQDHLLHAELLLGFRKLFADLQFTEKNQIEVGKLLQVVDTLYCRTRSDITTTIGTQQDATEMLILILEWLGTAFNSALHSQLHPELRIDGTANNFVVAESTASAPNSEMAGLAPPDYNWNQATVGTSTVHREAKSRPNSPIRKAQTEVRSLDDSNFPNRVSLKNNLLPIDEAMDTTEMNETSRLTNTLQTGPASSVVSNPCASLDPETSEDLLEFVNGLKQSFDDIFTATLHSSTVSEDNSVSSESETKNCPQFFQMQVSYGNLHDALEANTYDTGRNTVSHVQNLYDNLPAAIFMGLSRFGYTNGPSKLHEKFSFPKTLFMDRYLKENADLVSTLREQQKKYREELSSISAQLNGLLRYPYGQGGEARLADVFETTIQALSDVRVKEEPMEASYMFPGPFIPSAFCTTKRSESQFVEDRGKIFPKFNLTSSSCMETLRKLTDDLLAEEQRCRGREMELERLINGIYDIEALSKHQYELRAMIVHSGDANHGHYWTYRVKKFIDGCHIWEKLNDQVTEQVEWAQVEKDAFGNGFGESPSAYMLMYVRSDATWLDAADEMTTNEALATLPNDVQEYVNEKRNAWKEELKRFREQKASAALPKETTNAFAWTKKEDKNDENANPNGKTFILTDSLNATEVYIANDNEVAEVSRMTSRLWNTLMKIEPHQLTNDIELLHTHLQKLMMGPEGGLAYIESKLEYPIGELRDDAENDIEKVYNSFITGFLDATVDKSRFLMFVKVMLNHLNLSALRFLLVHALAVSNVPAFSSRARSELEGFESFQYDTSHKMLKVAYLISHVYEMGHLISWSTRFSLETLQSTDVGRRPSNDQKESIYLAMITARTARVCSRVLSDEFVALPDVSSFFVSLEHQQLTTILSLMKMLKILLHYLTNHTLKLTDMEFILTHNERRVKVDEILFEISGGVSRLHSWYRRAENQRQVSFKNNGDTGNASFNIQNAYTIINTSFELVATCPAVECDMEKVNCVTSIRTLLTVLDEGEERVPTDLGSFHPLPFEEETQTVESLCRDIGNVNTKLEKILSEIQEIISNIYG